MISVVSLGVVGSGKLAGWDFKTNIRIHVFKTRNISRVDNDEVKK